MTDLDVVDHDLYLMNVKMSLDRIDEMSMKKKMYLV